MQHPGITAGPGSFVCLTLGREILTGLTLLPPTPQKENNAELLPFRVQKQLAFLMFVRYLIHDFSVPFHLLDSRITTELFTAESPSQTQATDTP